MPAESVAATSGRRGVPACSDTVRKLTNSHSKTPSGPESALATFTAREANSESVERIDLAVLFRAQRADSLRRDRVASGSRPMKCVFQGPERTRPAEASLVCEAYGVPTGIRTPVATVKG